MAWIIFLRYIFGIISLRHGTPSGQINILTGQCFSSNVNYGPLYITVIDLVKPAWGLLRCSCLCTCMHLCGCFNKISHKCLTNQLLFCWRSFLWPKEWFVLRKSGLREYVCVCGGDGGGGGGGSKKCRSFRCVTLFWHLISSQSHMQHNNRDRVSNRRTTEREAWSNQCENLLGSWYCIANSINANFYRDQHNLAVINYKLSNRTAGSVWDLPIEIKCHSSGTNKIFRIISDITGIHNSRPLALSVSVLHSFVSWPLWPDLDHRLADGNSKNCGNREEIGTGGNPEFHWRQVLKAIGPIWKLSFKLDLQG